MTVEEAARLLGISRSTAYECVRDGTLPALRLRRRIVVPTSALESLLGD
jgi:excisionase family DNA binding protein